MEQQHGRPDLQGQVAVVTGGGGVLGGSMARGLAAAGARVVVIGRSESSLKVTREAVVGAGGDCLALCADVLDEGACRQAASEISAEFGQVDILVNAAGGASPEASTGVEQVPAGYQYDGLSDGDPIRTILDVPIDALRKTGDLNYLGTVIPTQAFLRGMIDRQTGCIVNISSMGAQWPLTKSPAYSAGKAAVENYTRWLATHLALVGIRVNAISPGFFLTKQNRYLLIDEATGELSPRGRTILKGTPMGRFGEPHELNGALLWLVSDSAGFVTGATIPVDGGFGSFGGV